MTLENGNKEMAIAKKGLEILLVDDNAADAKLISRLFQEDSYSGSLVWVNDGAQALDYLFRRGDFFEVRLPDVVLLDLNMPRVSGWEVLDQISRNEEIRPVPVIVLTTSNRKEDIQKSIEKGAAAFYTKPSEFLDLKRLVQHLKLVEFIRLGVGLSHAQNDLAKVG